MCKYPCPCLLHLVLCQFIHAVIYTTVALLWWFASVAVLYREISLLHMSKQPSLYFLLFAFIFSSPLPIYFNFTTVYIVCFDLQVLIRYLNRNINPRVGHWFYFRGLVPKAGQMPRRISVVGSQPGGGSIYQTLRQHSATPTRLCKVQSQKSMKVFASIQIVRHTLLCYKMVSAKVLLEAAQSLA